MSFLFEDDDPYSISLSQQPLSVLSQQTAAAAAAANEAPVFHCENCGSNEAYYDSSTGKDVCQNCFTQSQQVSTQQDVETLDYDEVMGLAARARSGNVIHSYTHKTKRRDDKKLTIQKLDQTETLPTLGECLDGMKRVLRKCAKILGRKLQLNIMDDVQHLWVSYLRAYADAAEHYAQMYPLIRFSLRDVFFARNPVTSHHLLSTLIYNITEKIHKERSEKGEDDEEEQQQGQPVKLKPTNQRPTFALVRERILGANFVEGHRSGYKECALVLDPNMDFVAALLWLAVAKSGVTTCQICQFLANHTLPLQNAYQRLVADEKLKKRLRPVRLHFEMRIPLYPERLEHLASLLAVACRMQSQGSHTLVEDPTLRSGYKDAIRFWSPESLPLVLARLVVSAGLDQSVLNRSLALLGLPVPSSSSSGSSSSSSDDSERLPLPLPKGEGSKVTCTNDLLAIVALACQMDPTWHTWSFRRSNDFAIPYSESQMQTLTNQGFSKYLQFGLEKFSDPQESMLWEGFDDLESLLRRREFNDEADFLGKQKPALKPCNTFAGARFSKRDRKRNRSSRTSKVKGKESYFFTEHPRLALLIDYLAYTARGSSSEIRKKMKACLRDLEMVQRGEQPSAQETISSRKRIRKAKPAPRVATSRLAAGPVPAQIPPAAARPLPTHVPTGPPRPAQFMNRASSGPNAHHVRVEYWRYMQYWHRAQQCMQASQTYRAGAAGLENAVASPTRAIL